MAQWIVRLDGSGLPEKSAIGGKGWSIARMAALGLPVPPAFVITCAACVEYQQTGGFPDGLEDELRQAMSWLEKEAGRTFGSGTNPLLVAVRSGAPVSMPGMMDTVLNLGVSSETVPALEAEFGDKSFVHDTHRRFYELFSDIVLRCTAGDFRAQDDEPTWARLVKDATGTDMPESCEERLEAAIQAVFESWNGRRAKRYRKHHAIPDDLGTAVVVQAMVFGNLNENSGTGVMFSRNPITGTREPYGEFLMQAQGEDVVSGKFTPRPLQEMRELLPRVYDELLEAADVLEKAGGDVQDIEFTVQDGKLYLLQTRSAKRAPEAALRIACDLLDEGVVDLRGALMMVSPEQVRSILAPRLSRTVAEKATLLAEGVAACPGIGIGRVVCDSDTAERLAEQGEDVILARRTTSPDDLHGMIASVAVITEMGGATSHAAVVGRSLGVPCVVGCGAGLLEELEGQIVTVDGTTGSIYAGELEIEMPDSRKVDGIRRLTAEADSICPIRVIRPEDVTDEPFDLSLVEGGDDINRLPELLVGKRTVKGAGLYLPGGIEAARAAGVECVVARPRLPLMLAAIHQEAAAADGL
jgi:pyruvate,orthophosphate dikinase